MKKLLITVEGKAYEVEVEELKEEASTPSSTREKAAGQSNQSGSTGESSKKENSPKAPETPAKNDTKKDTAKSSRGQIVAPMPGTVLDIKVNKGDEISNGQVVAVLEAMKMENEIKASGAGTVKDILVSTKESVDSGDPLIELE